MDVIALTRAFVDIPSTTFEEGPLGEYLESVLSNLAERFDGNLELQTVAEGRKNLFISWGSPTVVLSTHYDCVPPFIPSSEDDENVYGRGACDANGILAAMIVAAEKLLEHGIRNFGILAVVGEERNSEGAYFAAKTVVDIVTQLWGPMVFSLIAYFMIGYQMQADKFFIYMGFMMLDSISALSLATMGERVCVLPRLFLRHVY
jgi:hypothetical protein